MPWSRSSSTEHWLSYDADDDGPRRREGGGKQRASRASNCGNQHRPFGTESRPVIEPEWQHRCFLPPQHRQQRRTRRQWDATRPEMLTRSSWVMLFGHSCRPRLCSWQKNAQMSLVENTLSLCSSKIPPQIVNNDLRSLILSEKPIDAVYRLYTDETGQHFSVMMAVNMLWYVRNRHSCNLSQGERPSTEDIETRAVITAGQHKDQHTPLIKPNTQMNSFVETICITPLV